MSRRVFLGLTGGTAAVGILLGGGLAYSRNRVLTAPTFSDYPFTLGVASGEPVHAGVSQRMSQRPSFSALPYPIRRDLWAGMKRGPVLLTTSPCHRPS